MLKSMNSWPQVEAFHWLSRFPPIFGPVNTVQPVTVVSPATLTNYFTGSNSGVGDRGEVFGIGEAGREGTETGDTSGAVTGLSKGTTVWRRTGFPISAMFAHP